MNGRAGRLVADYGVLIVLAVIVAAMAAATPHFLTVPNLMNVLRQVSINAVIACGMTLVIITAGIDHLGRLAGGDGELSGHADDRRHRFRPARHPGRARRRRGGGCVQRRADRLGAGAAVPS